MTTYPFRRPRIPSHYYIWFEPPDNSGDEVLNFVSERRRVKLKGHSFREFQQAVIPLLDGQHTLEEIQQAVADLFSPADLEQGLQLLAEQNLLEDDAAIQPSAAHAQWTPQLNLFHELGLNGAEIMARLSRATVTVLGMGGAGSATAVSLATAGVGRLRCVDTSAVLVADSSLSPVFSPEDTGRPRTEVVARTIHSSAPKAEVETLAQPLKDDSDVLNTIRGSDFVINCLDPGQSSLVYKLNRSCLDANIRWTSCGLCGQEVVLGPTIHPRETACYLCYKMRTVACAGNPESEFAFERFLDRRKQDDSGRRENMVFGASIAAQMAGLEALKELSGALEPSAQGKIIVFDLLTLTTSRHVVLRKPWCPACFKPAAGTAS